MGNVFETVGNWLASLSFPYTYQWSINFCLGVFLFLLLVIIGGLVAKFIKRLTERVLQEKLKLDEIMKKHGLDEREVERWVQEFLPKTFSRMTVEHHMAASA